MIKCSKLPPPVFHAIAVDEKGVICLIQKTEYKEEYVTAYDQDKDGKKKANYGKYRRGTDSSTNVTIR